MIISCYVTAMTVVMMAKVGEVGEGDYHLGPPKSHSC